METPKNTSTVSGYLLNGASLVAIVAGLKLGGQVLLPLTIALFLAIVCLPIVEGLKSRHVPRPLAILLVLSGVVGLATAMGWLVGGTADDFTSVLPGYRDRIVGTTTEITTTLASHGLEINPQDLITRLDKPVFSLISEGARGLANTLSNMLLVILTTLFMLFEADKFGTKFHTAFDSPMFDHERFGRFSREMQTYLVVKTATSLCTGTLVGISMWALGVDFPVLLALMAFLLNYIPTLGSIIAAIPAVMLALIEPGGSIALVVAGVYAGVNISIGSLLEPQLLGKELGLSPLVVFLSLIFWGWVWGPVGMLLSVPLTMSGKIFLAHTEEFAWVSILLGNSSDNGVQSADS